MCVCVWRADCQAQRDLLWACGAEVRLWALQTVARDQHRTVTHIIDRQLRSSLLAPHRKQAPGYHNSTPIINRSGTAWEYTQPYVFILMSYPRNTRDSYLGTHVKSCDIKFKHCSWRRLLFWSMQLCRFVSCCGSFWEGCCPNLQPKTVSHSFPIRCSHLFHAVYSHWTALKIEVVSVTETSVTNYKSIQSHMPEHQFPWVHFFFQPLCSRYMCFYCQCSVWRRRAVYKTPVHKSYEPFQD